MLKIFICLITVLFSCASFADISKEGYRAKQMSFVRGSANLEVKEVSSVECRADVAGNLGGKYFVVYSALNAVKYVVWYDVADGNTAPVVVGTKVEVNISSGATAATVATNTKTALDAIVAVPFVTSRDTATLTITNSGYGVTTDIADVDTTHTSIVKSIDGVSGALAISSGNLITDMRGFEVCNDAVNTSTYLILSWSATIARDNGLRLGKGECFQCHDCTKEVLSTMQVSSEANANAYAVIQWKK